MHQPQQDPQEFWEERYVQSLERQRGRAGLILQQELAQMTPGRVLELGCSTGDDSLWLAEQGWQVTAVDLSKLAIQTAQRLATEAGLSEHIQFQACDLAESIPSGSFDLVCALYFQSPFDFPRAQILRTAANQLVSSGHLLLVSHASSPPWREHTHEFVFPTPETERAELALADEDWHWLKCGTQTRVAKGPEGQEAEVKDNVILIQRR